MRDVVALKLVGPRDGDARLWRVSMAATGEDISSRVPIDQAPALWQSHQSGTAVEVTLFRLDENGGPYLVRDASGEHEVAKETALVRVVAVEERAA